MLSSFPLYMEVGMEKISGIISSSPRVTSVDMKESSPVRSGTPGFGRAEAQVGRERASGDTMKQATEAQNEMHDWRSKDAKHAAIAKDMADKFFSKNKVDVEATPAPNEERISSIAGAAASKLAQSREMLEEHEAGQGDIESAISNPDARSAQPAGLHPKGSFINYAA
jgi:hypothetical protein